MRRYNIAIVPLDGVGIEVIPLGVKAIEKAASLVSGVDFEFQYYEAGVAYAEKTGKAMPEGLFENLKAADAMFCGSAGHYDLEKSKTEYTAFKICAHLPQFFRKNFANTVGLRPLQLISGIECPLKNRNEIDIFLLRQLSEGGYLTPGTMISDDAAYDVQVVTRSTTERLAEEAFKIARNRSGRRADGKKTVTLGNKHGIIACLDFYRKIFTEVSANYPDVELQFLQIDALAEQMLKDPDRFDVIVCENMHGDIIGDIGAYITGGMGVTPTADVGGITPHFRPNHGTFPRAVGKGIANPIASILTAKLMLEVLANENNDEILRECAKLIHKATEFNLTSGGPKTKDMGGAAGTQEAAEAVFKAMERSF